MYRVPGSSISVLALMLCEKIVGMVSSLVLKHRLVPLSVDSDEEDEEEESLSSREVVTVFPFLSLVNHNKLLFFSLRRVYVFVLNALTH